MLLAYYVHDLSPFLIQFGGGFGTGWPIWRVSWSGFSSAVGLPHADTPICDLIR